MPPRKSFGSQGESRGRDKDRDRDSRDDRDGKDSGREKFYRKKSCRFCQEKLPDPDYKDAKAFRSLLTERDKILPRRFTGLCARHQRCLTSTIKRARILGIVAFAPNQRKAV